MRATTATPATIRPLQDPLLSGRGGAVHQEGIPESVSCLSPIAKCLQSYQKNTIKGLPLALFSTLSGLQLAKDFLLCGSGIFAKNYCINDEGFGFILLGGFALFISALLWPYKLASVIKLQNAKNNPEAAGWTQSNPYLVMAQVMELSSAIMMTVGLSLAIISAIWAALSPAATPGVATTLQPVIEQFRAFGVDIPDPISMNLPPEMFLVGAGLLVIAALFNLIHACCQKDGSKWAKALGITAAFAESTVVALVIFMLPAIASQLTPDQLNSVNVGLSFVGLIPAGISFTTFACLLERDAQTAHGAQARDVDPESGEQSDDLDLDTIAAQQAAGVHAAPIVSNSSRLSSPMTVSNNGGEEGVSRASSDMSI